MMMLCFVLLLAIPSWSFAQCPTVTDTEAFGFLKFTIKRDAVYKCSWSIGLDNAFKQLLVIKLLALQSYTSNDTFTLPDGKKLSHSLPSRNLNDKKPSPICSGYVKASDYQSKCRNVMNRMCNQSEISIANNWPPKMKAKARSTQIIFAYSFFECPQIPATQEAALTTLGIICAILFVCVAALVYFIWRKILIERVKKANHIQEYATFGPGEISLRTTPGFKPKRFSNASHVALPPPSGQPTTISQQVFQERNCQSSTNEGLDSPNQHRHVTQVEIQKVENISNTTYVNNQASREETESQTQIVMEARSNNQDDQTANHVRPRTNTYLSPNPGSSIVPEYMDFAQQAQETSNGQDNVYAEMSGQ